MHSIRKESGKFKDDYRSEIRYCSSIDQMMRNWYEHFILGLLSYFQFTLYLVMFKETLG